MYAKAQSWLTLCKEPQGADLTQSSTSEEFWGFVLTGNILLSAESSLKGDIFNFWSKRFRGTWCLVFNPLWGCWGFTSYKFLNIIKIMSNLYIFINIQKKKNICTAEICQFSTMISFVIHVKENNKNRNKHNKWYQIGILS